MTNRRSARFVVALCLLMGILAGCGGSDTDAAAETAAETTGVEATSEPTTAPAPTAAPDPTAAPVPTATPEAVDQAVGEAADETLEDDGLVDEGDIATLEIDSLLAGVSLTDEQQDCVNELVGTPEENVNQNFVDLCLGADDDQGLLFVLRDVQPDVWDGLTDAEVECIAAEAEAIIENRQADDDFAAIRGTANCGFYGRNQFQALELFSPEVIACIDGAAIGTASTEETVRDVGRSLVAECGTAADLDALNARHAEDDAFREVVEQAVEEADFSEWDEDAFAAGMVVALIEALGIELTADEQACAGELVTGADDDVEIILDGCLDDERRFMEIAQVTMSGGGTLELTAADNECISEAFEAAGRPKLEMSNEESYITLILPVAARCETMGRLLSELAGVSPETAECVDENAMNFAEAAEGAAAGEEMMMGLVELCATPEELAALGL